MSSEYPTGDPFDDADDYSAAEQPVTDELWMTPLPQPVDEFDLPPVDMRTGELIEEPVQSITTLPPAGAVIDLGGYFPSDEAMREAEAVALPVTLAQSGALAVTLHAADVTPFVNDLSAALDTRIGATYSALVAARPAGAVTTETVAPELRFIADAHDVLAAIGGVFTRQAAAVRSLAGEVVQEVKRPQSVERPETSLERTGGSASIKVGTTGGAAIKATATQPTETFAIDEQIVDVLVPYLIDVEQHNPNGGLNDARESTIFASGVRAMASLLLGIDEPGLLAAPKWKSSALDELRLRLQGADDTASTALATRLRAAYGRRPVGNVQTKIERVPVKEVRDV